jgi:general secretion pathway protein M
MSAPFASVLLDTARESATLFWNSRNARERAMLASAALVLMLCLIYALCFGPALNGRIQLSKDLPALRQQAAELQALSKQASELNRASAVAVAPISRESIAASLANRGMKPQSLAVTDDVVRVQLNIVSFASVLDWIDEQQKSSHLIVIDANFAALPEADVVNANLTFRQQRSEEKFE